MHVKYKCATCAKCMFQQCEIKFSLRQKAKNLDETTEVLTSTGAAQCICPLGWLSLGALSAGQASTHNPKCSFCRTVVNAIVKLLSGLTPVGLVLSHQQLCDMNSHKHS